MRKLYCVVCVLTIALAGCDDSSGGPDAGGGITIMRDSGSGPAPGTDGGGGITFDAGGLTLTDGGGTTTPPDTPPGMGSIDCMGMTCDGATQQCCVNVTGMSATGECVARTDTCAGTPVDCDGPEDCGGDPCCLSFAGGGGSAACTPGGCGGGGGFGSLELCHAPTDCTDTSQMCCPIMMFGFDIGVCAPSCMFGGPPPGM